MRQILAISRISLKLAYGPTFFIFTCIGALFVLPSLLYFFLPELAQFGYRNAGQNAALAGLGSINLFLIFLSISLSLAVLMKQFRRDNLIFLLSKPIQPTQIFLGTIIALIVVFLSCWAFLSLELLVIIALFSKEFLFRTMLALFPVALLAILYTTLAVFFFSLWPSFLSAIFPFLLILTSLARVDIQSLISSFNILWLKKIIDMSFFFIPPVGQVMAISLKKLDFLNVGVNIGPVLLHSISITVLLLSFALLWISRRFSKL